MTTILMFTLKRVALARLQGVADGSIPIAGTDALLADDVQVAPILPADPDRVSVYFAPIRSTRVQRSAENSVVVESIPLEIRIRVYQPGVDDEDVATVEQSTDDVVNAVARALLDGQPLILPGMGNLNIAYVTQWPTALQATPEPGATGMASVILQADLVTS